MSNILRQQSSRICQRLATTMAHSKANERTTLLQKGTYRAPSADDIRGPCPIVNSFANHGYIPRDGRNVRAADMRAAMKEIGVSSTISTTLAYGAYLEHMEQPPAGWWALISGPFAYMLRKFGMRKEGQVDSDGIPCLNLDQLGLHGAVEHDVSLSRRDTAQGDNTSAQKDLIKSLVSCSRDGKDITTEDLAEFRRTRLKQQRTDNPKLHFTATENTMSCGEAAFIQRLFGQSERKWAIPVSYMKALFEDERIPVKEGWKKRSWWYLGFGELFSQAKTLQTAVGPVE